MIVCCFTPADSSQLQVEQALQVSHTDPDWNSSCAGVEVVAQKMPGGMRLTLTQQEFTARQSVLLPWEQRQVGAESQSEFARPAEKASLALKAGAGAQGQGSGHGHIFYERDSETDPDSDEDPDDDLDI
jgi:hypothetical protein